MHQMMSNLPPWYMLIVVLRSIYALNRVRDKISYCAGLQASKRSKVGCFWCVLEFGAIWEKPLFLFPLGHVTWRSEWRTELGTASHPISKFVFSLQLVSLLRQSICIGLLQNFLIIVGKHAEIWNYIYLHPFSQGKQNKAKYIGIFA